MNLYQNPLRLPQQWPHSGVGDPFVMRHNGIYYLYPSTPDPDCGVRVWISENMLDWADGGYVVCEECLRNAYAPEVFYHNGTFWLATSPGGQGHYLYAGESPTGPFARFGGPLGRTIDGSFFADDRGQLYFTHAEYPSIYGCAVSARGELGESRELQGASMGHWTEGPGIFKRGDTFYLTMTGNHLLSRGYRVQYALGRVSPLGPYHVPEQPVLLVNTDPATGSLGHSSTVLGPDLDSYWLFYHRFAIDEAGRHGQRFANMDRLLFNGEKLLVSGPTQHPCEAPAMPDFYGWADRPACANRFEWDGNRVMAAEGTPADYTAELCLTPGVCARVWFGVKAAGGCTVELANGRIRLLTVIHGQENLLAAGNLMEGFCQGAAHTVRLEARGGNMTVLVDQMTVLRRVQVLQTEGRLGASGMEQLSYVAFSRYVHQQSDALHAHAVPGAVEAALFLPRKPEDNLKRYDPALCGFRPEDGFRLVAGADGAQDVLFAAGETLRYRLNAAQPGEYRVQAVLAGCGTLLLKTEGSQATVSPTPFYSDAPRRVTLPDLWLDGGFQTVALSVATGTLLLRTLEWIPRIPPETGEFSGVELCRAARLMEGDGYLIRHEGLQMDRPVHALAMFGERTHVDQALEAEMIFRGDGAKQSAGIFLRLSEHSVYPDQIADAYRGYYIGFDMQTATVRRLNFGTRILAEVRCPLRVETPYRFRAAIVGGALLVWVEDALILQTEECDPLPFGCAGVGSMGARTTVTRVRFWADTGTEALNPFS